MNLDLSKIKSVFCIGIGGIGISALAQMFKSRGALVSGVNDDEGDTVNLLRNLGIQVTFLKDFKNLPEANLYVYSDAWLYRGPEIIENAKKTGKPVLSYFEALGEIAKNYKVIAISGTHGKTTTTAMVAGILTDAGLDPTVIVGSFVKKFGSNFRSGKGEYLVVEADEYNRHMLVFNPYIGLVTNIEADHLDVYKDLHDIQNAFREFLNKSENKITDYAKYLKKVPKLSVPGEHNRMNAAAALAVAEVLNIKEEIAQKSLAEFSGTWRRLEKRAVTEKGTIIYDDYAHHPTEIRASIEALRELYPKEEKNLTILFQPHLYSRTKALFSDFAKSFGGADRVLLLPIYYARESVDTTISSEKLAEAVAEEGENVEAYPDFESAERAVLSLNLGPKDVFVTMGAGEAYKVADKVFPDVKSGPRP
ncbi:MAG: cyanophycin synthetase [bacterium]|nr:cyanophycin synthetase [bacterium]